jgi:hypothetical protein
MQMPSPDGKKQRHLSDPVADAIYQQIVGVLKEVFDAVGSIWKKEKTDARPHFCRQCQLWKPATKFHRLTGRVMVWTDYCEDCRSARHTSGPTAVSLRTRYSVLQRDNFTCQYCGRSAPGVELNIDHRTPVSKGGSDEIDNLITSCAECNLGKITSTE